MSSGIKYTREQMAQAAESCADIDEVIAFFGSRPYKRLRSYLVQRFAHFDIDVSHFRRHAYGRHSATAPDTLPQVVSTSRSLADALRRLGLPDNATTRRLLRRWIAEGTLDTSHFLGQAHQRGKPDFFRLRADEILVKRNAGRRTNTPLLRRALREIGVAEQCATCGSGPSWHGRPMTLEIDHINGDWSDDRRENLRLLCPNCHAITSTWCRGGRRRSA